MAGRPKLLVLASTFPRWLDDTEPRFVESLSYELADRFDVIVLAPHCRGAARQERLRNRGRTIDVHRYRYCISALETLAYDGGMLSRVRENPFRLLLLPPFLLAQFLSATRLLREHRIDAIHAHWIVPQGLIAVAFRAWSRRSIPVLITSHGGDLYALRGRLLKRLKRWILGRADSVTVVSSAMREYCERRGFAPGRIDVQSMGVDLDTRFTPGSDDTPREGLVFVGRLVEKKGVAHLIEAMAILTNRWPKLHLNVIGDGPLRESLSALADSVGVSDSIHFLGSLRSADLPDRLRTAKIAVMPSVVASSGDQEGLGLVAIEALGCGCAVVASDLPPIRDTIVDGQTGLTAKPADAADLASKIAMLLEDDELCGRLAEVGRQHAMDKFRWPVVGRNYSRIISELIQSA